MIKEHQKLVSRLNVDNLANGLFMTRRCSQEKGSRSKCKRRSKSKKHKSVTCYHGHQIGHIRRNCPEWNEKSGNSANITIACSDNSDAGSALTISFSELGNEGIIDSGKSFHMAPNRSFFNSYKKQEGKFRLGDNKIISIIVKESCESD